MAIGIKVAQINKSERPIQAPDFVPNSSKFLLFHEPITDTYAHKINWYVYRNTSICHTLQGLWAGGQGITNKKTMENATKDQQAFHAINALMRLLQNRGPNLDAVKQVNTDYIDIKQFVNDTKHGLFHCHTGSKPTYVILWEAFEDEKIIYIHDIDTHENFDFNPKRKKAIQLQIAKNARDNDPRYLANVERFKKAEAKLTPRP